MPTPTGNVVITITPFPDNGDPEAPSGLTDSAYNHLYEDLVLLIGTVESIRPESNADRLLRGVDIVSAADAGDPAPYDWAKEGAHV